MSNSLTQLVSTISEPVLVAVVAATAAFAAAGIALFGVWLQNRAHTQNLRLQLESTANENAIERILAIRRPVYLNYAERSIKAFEAIGTYLK